MSKSSGEALAVLNRLRENPVGTPVTRYVGLATLNEGLPVEFVAGSGVGQAAGYARVALQYADPAALDPGLVATLLNTAIALFGVNSGVAAWPTPARALFFETLTGGSWIRQGTLIDQTVVVLPGQAARFPVGAIKHTET